jgi:hypothetical protein
MEEGNKMMDYQVQKFKEELCALMNAHTELPFTVKSYVLHETMLAIEPLKQQAIKQQMEQMAQSEKMSKEKENLKEC